jgi:hypothetical protein
MTEPNRTQDKLLSFGQLFAAADEARLLRDEARDLLDAGASDDEVCSHVITRGRELGLIGPRVMLPSLTRRITRMSMPAFLNAAAKLLAKKYQGKRVGDVADGLWSRIGMDHWLASYVLDWAKTGEPGPFFESFGGRVWVQRIGLGEPKVDSVWCVITPSSHPQELLRQAFEESVRVFPPETFSRYGYSVEAHRIVRMKTDDPSLSYGDIAERLLDEREPQLREMGREVFAERRDSERKRIEKLVSRFWEDYADSFFSYLSPESD